MYKHKVCLFFNISRKLYLRNIPILPKAIRVLIRILFSCDIPYTANIQPSVDFMHNGLGVVIHSRATIGHGTIVYQNVTIGGNGKEGELNGPPIIGENVIIGAGAAIIGPVKIGNYAQIGANAVVLNDVPSYGVAVGVPAKTVKINNIL